MALSVKPSHLRRYKDIVRLLARYANPDSLRGSRLEEDLLLEEDAEQTIAKGSPEELANDLEELGPTFVKLGQVLSSRPDLLPMPFIEALSRLQDRVEPFPFEDVERILQEELGVRISKAFDEFEPEPIAAASLGQVHFARLRGGKPVAVKVQRPEIRQIILRDVAALAEVAEFLDGHTEFGRQYGLAEMLEQFRKSILRELDYLEEAQNLVTLSRNLAKYNRLLVPRPIDDYTTSRVLTMDFIRGKKITKLSPVGKTELNGRELAEQLTKAYLDQVLVDGFVHADPHPGNVFITDDGRLALIDLGMVARVDSASQERLMRLLLAIVEGDGLEAAAIAREIGVVMDGFDEAFFNREVSELVLRYQHATMEDINVGRIVVEIVRISSQSGVRPPPELTMLGKALLNLDEVSRTLAPDMDPNEVVRGHADSIMRRRMLKRFSPGQLFSAALEVNELVQELPSRINKVLRALASNEFTLRLDAIDEVRFLKNINSVADRLSLSIVLAALILGAALMMRVETEFTILGYPGFAMLMFIFAAACGIALVASIVFESEKLKSRGDDGKSAGPTSEKL